MSGSGDNELSWPDSFQLVHLARNERAATVRQACEHEQNTAATNAANGRQTLTIESVALSDYGNRSRDMAVMGSLSPRLSIISIMTS